MDSATPKENYGSPQLAPDVLAAVEVLRGKHNDITALLFECAGFPVVTSEVREKTGGCPSVTNARVLMSGYTTEMVAG
ncbi:hypothetical protein ABH995_000872 [Bradyrhizobium yuanmingense]|uniref:hypothetical protein n=1 Tax=Bradyrhizobium yuanmingense TaxID=108015 RepID=UPI003511F6E0